MQKTWVRSLGLEDPLEKEMATHSSILAWRTPWMEEPGGLQSTGSQSQTWLRDFTFTFIFLISSAFVSSLPFLSFIVPIFTWNVPLGISDFLEEISSLSHSIVFLCFFELITWESFLTSLCYSLELSIQMDISFLFCFAFHFSSKLSYLWSLLRQLFCLFAFLMLGMVLFTSSYIMSWTSIHSSSCTLLGLIHWMCLSFPLYNCEGFDLEHTWMA